MGRAIYCIDVLVTKERERERKRERERERERERAGQLIHQGISLAIPLGTSTWKIRKTNTLVNGLSAPSIVPFIALRDWNDLVVFS